MYDILIIEDDKSSGKSLEEFLRKEGYGVLGIYGSGEESLRSIGDAVHPDLVLINIRIPDDSDLISVSERIIGKQGIPIVFITSAKNKTSIEKSEWELPENHIVKPFNSNILASKIEAAVNSAKKKAQEEISEVERKASHEKDRIIGEGRERELQKEENSDKNFEVWDKIIEQTMEPLLMADRKGAITRINPKFCKILNSEAGDILGKNIFSEKLFNYPDKDSQKILKEKDSWEGEILNSSISESPFYLNAKISMIRDQEGKVIRIVLSAQDKTSEKLEKKNLEETRKLLLQSSMGTFSNDMDWQTWKEKMLNVNTTQTDNSIFQNINNSFSQGAGFGPLVSLMNKISAMAEEKDDKIIVDKTIFSNAMENVQIAQNALKTFAIMDWIIGNEMELKTTQVKDLYGIIKIVIERFKDKIEINKQRVIINEFPKEISQLKVKINLEYFAEAIGEIIINSLKFSNPKSKISVMIYVQNDLLKISVLNSPHENSQGMVGIPRGLEKVVFEPFYRISKQVFEKYHTLDFGLGLTFVQNIIRKHGGDIFAENIIDHSDIQKEPLIKTHIMMSLPILDK